jgi:hypothetical protein
MHTKTTGSKTVDTVTAGASDVCAAAEVESARNAPERIKLGDLAIHRCNPLPSHSHVIGAHCMRESQGI